MRGKNRSVVISGRVDINISNGKVGACGLRRGAPSCFSEIRSKAAACFVDGYLNRHSLRQMRICSKYMDYFVAHLISHWQSSTPSRPFLLAMTRLTFYLPGITLVPSRPALSRLAFSLPWFYKKNCKWTKLFCIAYVNSSALWIMSKIAIINFTFVFTLGLE